MEINNSKHEQNVSKSIAFRIFIFIGVILAIMLLSGQTYSLMDYDQAVSMGLQESVEEVSEVGVAWAKGFALADTLLYLPLLLLGIGGLLKRKAWGLYSMVGAMAITAYWPIVSLATVFIGRDTLNLNPDKYVSYSIILPLIALYGLWGIWYLYQSRDELVN
ncbi:hypothetical protein [Methanolobus sp.]|jgi:hypothetical protein|uniref:hypothetical protein n=1 Tax=Methanolobus sp. TaxID=1874737 RepID=UPI0025FFD5A9|nr:hypothetical protein [Methanolobus sp.]